MTKVTWGMLLVLAMAIPASAGVIGSPTDPAYLNTMLIDPTAAVAFVDGSTLTSFSGGGLWSGTPTTAGTYSFTLEVTDFVGTHVSKAFKIVIAQ